MSAYSIAPRKAIITVCLDPNFVIGPVFSEGAGGGGSRGSIVPLLAKNLKETLTNIHIL